jgi:predicted enzyme related to lactoylglutathione lyase
MKKRPIVHIDIPTTNRAVTAEFYATLFGWEFRHDTYPYTWFFAENINGGFVDLVAGLEPVREVLKEGDVVLYLPSDDIDLDLKRIETLGGTILLPKTRANEGHYIAIFADPNGVRLGLAGAK